MSSRTAMSRGPQVSPEKTNLEEGSYASNLSFNHSHSNATVDVMTTSCNRSRANTPLKLDSVSESNGETNSSVSNMSPIAPSRYG